MSSFSDPMNAAYQGATDVLYKDTEKLDRGLAQMQKALVRSGNFRFLDSPKNEIYSFSTPLIITPAQHKAAVSWTQRIARALESLGHWMKNRPERVRDLMLFKSSLDELFFQLDPGYPQMLPIYRMDFALSPSIAAPQLLEVNCGCPGGELDPALVAEAFFESSLSEDYESVMKQSMSSDIVELKYFDSRDNSLACLLTAYKSFRETRRRFPESPTIALITAKAQARFMYPECRGIALHYQSRGYKTLVGDLADLNWDGKQVFLGDEPVHLIFRKFSTLGFRLCMEKPDRFGLELSRTVRNIWKALTRHHVCMVNPLGSTVLQDKGILEVLAKRYQEIRPAIPETFILTQDLPSKGSFLWDEISSGEMFILKRRRSFSGRHVVMDPEKIRTLAPVILKEEPGQWVAQRRVPLSNFPFAVLDESKRTLGQFKYVLSPFGRSYYVRMGTGDNQHPVNAHAGGASTCALVMDQI